MRIVYWLVRGAQILITLWAVAASVRLAGVVSFGGPMDEAAGAAWLGGLLVYAAFWGFAMVALQLVAVWARRKRRPAP